MDERLHRMEGYLCCPHRAELWVGNLTPEELRCHRFSWYALYTRHQHEKSVALALSQKGIETFLPLYTTRSWADREKNISLPLFPCYVFVRGNFTGQELQILLTPGVHDFVRSFGHISVIPAIDIDAVRRMVQSSLRIAPHPFLKLGAWVRIKSGPLTGLEGILHHKKNLYRLVRSMELLQRSVAVELDVDAVERIERPDRRGLQTSNQHNLNQGHDGGNDVQVARASS